MGIPGEDRRDFHQWLQRASDDFLHNFYGKPYANLVLKTSNSGSAYFTCRSPLCTIDATSYNSHTQHLRHRLTLHAANLKRKRKKKKNQDKHKGPTSNEGGSSSSSL